MEFRSIKDQLTNAVQMTPPVGTVGMPVYGRDWIMAASDQAIADKANNRVVNPGLCEQLDRIEAKLDRLLRTVAHDGGSNN